jgi:hypothetical protein
MRLKIRIEIDNEWEEWWIENADEEIGAALESVREKAGTIHSGSLS